MSKVQEWYRNKTIFITGATGFMGKVLLEKILRCLPEVQEVVLLVRPKRGVDSAQRIENLKSLVVFERLLQLNPNAFEKVSFVEGNLSEENLGLTQSDQGKLSGVNVVFHMAASLRMEAGIRDAVIANTLATKLLLDLCIEMTKLDCFVLLSTAFCYPDKETLDERVYEPHVNPYEIIKYAQSEDEKVSSEKKAEIISPHPNTYTFSKRLAEWIAHDYRKKLPLAIARPSIVIPAFKEPIPGWVDTLNGPIGILCAAGKGVLRSMLCVEHYPAQVVPVDIAINTLIMIPCQKHLTKEELPVYNLNIPNNYVSMSWGDLLKTGRDLVAQYPFEWTLWYPDGAIRTNVYMHWLVLLLFQWIPAVFLDMIFFIVGRERFMVRVQKKITNGLEVLQYFTMRRWNFVSQNCLDMFKRQNGIDDEIFYSLNCTYNLKEYLTSTLLVIKKYMFKENLDRLPFQRIVFKFLYVLHVTSKYIFLYFTTTSLLKVMGFGFVTKLNYWFNI